MDKDAIRYNTKNIDVGFHSIYLDVKYDITIKRGPSVKCNATFYVNNGTLYIESNNTKTTLSIPQVPLDIVEISTEYGSVKCIGLNCNQLTISTAYDIKIKNSQINECEISSEHGSVHILQSTINILDISASYDIDVELNDFNQINIDTTHGRANVKYNGNSLVNVNCTSTYGSVKANGPFYGDENCAKKITIDASHSIKLISRN